MAARTDLLLDANGDLPIAAKLMTVGPSDLQHQRDMFSAFPGEWKQFPQNGVGVRKYLKASGFKLLTLENKGRQALQADGYSAGKMKFSTDDNGKLITYTNASR